MPPPTSALSSLAAAAAAGAKTEAKLHFNSIGDQVRSTLLYDGMATAAAVATGTTASAAGSSSLKTTSKAFKAKMPTEKAMVTTMQQVAETAVRRIDKELDNYQRMVMYSVGMGEDEDDDDDYFVNFGRICEGEEDECSSSEGQEEEDEEDVDEGGRKPAKVKAAASTVINAAATATNA